MLAGIRYSVVFNNIGRTGNILKWYSLTIMPYLIWREKKLTKLLNYVLLMGWVWQTLCINTKKQRKTLISEEKNVWCLKLCNNLSRKNRRIVKVWTEKKREIKNLTMFTQFWSTMFSIVLTWNFLKFQSLSY